MECGHKYMDYKRKHFEESWANKSMSGQLGKVLTHLSIDTYLSLFSIHRSEPPICQCDTAVVIVCLPIAKLSYILY